jgi:hypothetical protein
MGADLQLQHCGIDRYAAFDVLGVPRVSARNPGTQPGPVADFESVGAFFPRMAQVADAS